MREVADPQPRINRPQIEQLPSTPSDLSQYAWHQALSSYGHHSQSTHSEEEEEEPPKEDESTEVLNALVTSVIIPRLVSIAKESYDPLSSKQTVSALKLVDEISYSVERDSPRFEVSSRPLLFYLSYLNEADVKSALYVLFRV